MGSLVSGLLQRSMAEGGVHRAVWEWKGELDCYDDYYYERLHHDYHDRLPR